MLKCLFNLLIFFLFLSCQNINNTNQKSYEKKFKIQVDPKMKVKK